jgi:uncharacterized membrane protein YkoI
MNRIAKVFTAAIFATGLAACSSHDNHEDHEADESKELHENENQQSAAALAKFPQPVQDAIKQVVGNHELGDVDSETENGKTIYEADYKIHKTEYSVSVNDAGQIVEHEVTVDPSAVPSAVFDAAKNAHPNATIGEVDITASNGKLFYELDVKTSDNKYEMQINADGSVISDGVDKD